MKELMSRMDSWVNRLMGGWMKWYKNGLYTGVMETWID